MPRGDKYWSSDFNIHVIKESKYFPKAEQIRIADCTLRSGENLAGVMFDLSDKIAIARALDEFGVHEIEAGFPIVSEGEKEAVKAVVKERLTAKITAMCRAVKADIDAALECDVWGLYIKVPVGKPSREYKLKKSEDEAIQLALDTAEYAKGHGVYVILSATDSGRASLELLKKYFKRAVDEVHVDRIRISDYGTMLPQAVEYLVKEVRKIIGDTTPIEARFHNHLGLATANTLAAFFGGASVASCAVHGMPEDAATEEVALGLYVLGGVDLKLNWEKLYKLSQLVAKVSGIKPAPYKSIVGERVFTLQSGGQMDRPFINVFLPELIGQKWTYVLSKGVGKYIVQRKLDELNLKVNEDKIPLLVQKIKNLAEKKKSLVSDEEFITLIKEMQA